MPRQDIRRPPHINYNGAALPANRALEDTAQYNLLATGAPHTGCERRRDTDGAETEPRTSTVRRRPLTQPTAHQCSSAPPRFSRQVVYSFPFFALAMALAIIGFFNFQKQESSVVSSTLYALRTNPLVRQELGNEIYFASRFPWIRGEINQMRGLIDIEFWVKGTKSSGQVSLKCKRRGRNGYYVTSEWSLTMEDGRVLHLYDPKGDAIDPFMEPTAR